jgi:hypothetical protein
MTIEAALIKPVVDAILRLVKAGEGVRLQRNAEQAVREAIRELLQANPNDSKVEAKLAIAKAAGLISHDVMLAEDMLKKVRKSNKAKKKATTKKLSRRKVRSSKTKSKAPAKKS